MFVNLKYPRRPRTVGEFVNDVRIYITD